MTTLVTDIVTGGYGCPTDNVSDCRQAFLNFRTAGQGKDCTLNCPTHTYTFGSYTLIPPGNNIDNLWLFKGLKSLRLIGNGSTFLVTDTTLFGGSGQIQNNLNSARLATVTAGSSSVTLIDSSGNPDSTLASLFIVVIVCFIMGFHTNGTGFPSNPHWFEWPTILSVVGAVITFTAPLTNTYKSTWPVFNSGSAGEVDKGGPATLYALDPSWDASFQFENFTLNSTTGGQINTASRSTIWSGVTFPNYPALPSQNEYWQATGCTFQGVGSDKLIEVDKIVTQMDMTSSSVVSISFQSSSIGLFTADNLTVTGSIVGTPRRTIITNSPSIASLTVGARARGSSDSVTVNNCGVAAFGSGGILEKAKSDDGVNIDWTMANGIITIPNSYFGTGFEAWRMPPGTWCMWHGGASGAGFYSELGFQILDVTQDATNVYVRTNWPGGFPPVPTADGRLYIQVHPCPVWTGTGNSGDSGFVDLNASGAQGRPLNSYSRRVYTKADTAAPGNGLVLWGKLSQATFDVTIPYSGGALTMLPISQFGFPVIKSDYTSTNYSPRVDLTTQATRIVRLSGVTSGQGGDSNLAVPDSTQTWFTGGAGNGATTSSNVSAGGNNFSITVEVITEPFITRVGGLRLGLHS